MSLRDDMKYKVCIPHWGIGVLSLVLESSTMHKLRSTGVSEGDNQYHIVIPLQL